METNLHEIADGIYRISTLVPEVAPPDGFTFNQFLIDADEPLLFHCGQRFLFPSVSAAVRRVIDLDRLRWITFSHVEADESGSVNNWLTAAPKATAAHGRIGCAIWLTDAADRPPRALADGEWLDLGGKSVQRIDTPHVPHSWDAGLLYERTTGTLFCSDLFTHLGDPPALTDGDIVGPSIAAEELFHFTSLTPSTGATMRRLAALEPKRLAVMHGSSFSGDARPVLEALADYYDGKLKQAIA
jgi:flavorubredoxin